MTSILEVEQLDTLSSNASNTITIGGTNTSNVTFKSGVNFSGITQGITGADQWRLTTNFSPTSNAWTLINSGWSRVNNADYGKIGSGITESSGAFAFPSTGLWKIDFTIVIYVSNATVNYSGGAIYVTTDNSGYYKRTQIYSSIYPQWTTLGSSYLFNVTDTSTHKVKFFGRSENTSANFIAETNDNATHATFIRLGDSV